MPRKSKKVHSKEFADGIKSCIASVIAYIILVVAIAVIGKCSIIHVISMPFIWVIGCIILLGILYFTYDNIR